jgi:hypothetical protein
MMVHLAQATLCIGLVRSHDADIVDALAAARSDIEAESKHRDLLLPPQRQLHSARTFATH